MSGRHEGIGINAQTKDSDMQLHLAVRENAHKKVEVLLRHGADPNAKDKYGDTPLHWAVRNNAYETAGVLLKHGADPNAKNNFGDTRTMQGGKIITRQQRFCVIMAWRAEVKRFW